MITIMKTLDLQYQVENLKELGIIESQSIIQITYQDNSISSQLLAVDLLRRNNRFGNILL